MTDVQDPTRGGDHDLVALLAWRSRLLSARHQEVRVVLVEEDGHYYPALVLDAVATNRKWAVHQTAKLNRDLVPLVLEAERQRFGPV